jgi:DUF4097 and DUF4098 domain-containing protein YvlB
MPKKKYLRFIPLLGLMIVFLYSSIQAADFSFQPKDILSGLFGQKKSEEFYKTLPLKADGSFSLKNVNGSITISTWKREEVEIKAIKTTKHDPEKLKEVKIEIQSTPGSILIETIYPKRRNIRVNVDYEVKVPEGVNLERIRTVNGSVIMSGPLGKAAVSTTNGRVELDGASGDLYLSTTNGSIGAFDVTGELEAHTTNGSIELELDTLEDGVKAKTVNGSITLRFRTKKVDADFKARTVNGKIYMDFPLTFKTIQKSKRTLEGQIGQGGVEIHLSTVNGSIRITR